MKGLPFIRQANDAGWGLRPAADSMYNTYSPLPILSSLEQTIPYVEVSAMSQISIYSTIPDLMDQPRSRSRFDMPLLPCLQPSSLAQTVPFVFSSMNLNAH